MYIDMEDALDEFLSEHPLPNPPGEDWVDGPLSVLNEFIEWCVGKGYHHFGTDAESWGAVFARLEVSSSDGSEMVAFYLSKVPSDQ